MGWEMCTLIPFLVTSFRVDMAKGSDFSLPSFNESKSNSFLTFAEAKVRTTAPLATRYISCVVKVQFEILRIQDIHAITGSLGCLGNVVFYVDVRVLIYYLVSCKLLAQTNGHYGTFLACFHGVKLHFQTCLPNPNTCCNLRQINMLTRTVSRTIDALINRITRPPLLSK